MKQMTVRQLDGVDRIVKENIRKLEEDRYEAKSLRDRMANGWVIISNKQGFTVDDPLENAIEYVKKDPWNWVFTDLIGQPVRKPYRVWLAWLDYVEEEYAVVGAFIAIMKFGMIATTVISALAAGIMTAVAFGKWLF